MSVSRPFRRTCRPFVDGEYARGGRSAYILHPKFAVTPLQYIRAFEVLQKDVLELFDYIEPADTNLNTYSYRIHALLMRVCIEVEANFRAIFEENGCTLPSNASIIDYRKLENTHRLSSFSVRLPVWRGSPDTRSPYKPWGVTPAGKLPWYRAYNKSKHSRHVQFELANFDNLLEAICGLVIILSSQFHIHDFSPISYVGYGPSGNFSVAIGGYFQVEFPNDWPAVDRYDFNWNDLRTQSDPFQNLTF